MGLMLSAPLTRKMDSVGYSEFAPGTTTTRITALLSFNSEMALSQLVATTMAVLAKAGTTSDDCMNPPSNRGRTRPLVLPKNHSIIRSPKPYLLRGRMKVDTVCLSEPPKN